MIKILLVEDDRTISAKLKEFLYTEGFDVSCVFTQSEAFGKLYDDFELALVDLTLPDGSGYTVCKALKSVRDVPVIFLTACTDEFSVVAGFDMGIDDYIEKPYRPHELVSRIKNALRKSGRQSSLITIGGVSLDTVKGIVKKGGSEIFLSALEYKLLLFFFNAPGTTFTRGRILSEMWDMGGEFVNDNTLTVYIKRLREKIEDDPQDPKIILTVRGIGYKSATPGDQI